jgi:hypothetical protein
MVCWFRERPPPPHFPGCTAAGLCRCTTKACALWFHAGVVWCGVVWCGLGWGGVVSCGVAGQLPPVREVVQGGRSRGRGTRHGQGHAVLFPVRDMPSLAFTRARARTHSSLPRSPALCPSPACTTRNLPPPSFVPLSPIVP